MPLTVCSPQTTGLQSGSWCSFGEEFELPGDQRADDGKSLVFDSAACEESFEMLGAASVTLTQELGDLPHRELALQTSDGERTDSSRTQRERADRDGPKR